MSPVPAQTRESILTRDGDCCRRCGVHVSVRGYSLHHRQGRGGADPHRFSNLVTLCGSATTPNGCHLWAHANPADAYATGWMVRRQSLDNTEDVPLIDVYGRAVGLTDDGDVIAFASAAEGSR